MKMKPFFVRSFLLLLLFFFACFVVWPMACMFGNITPEQAAEVFSSALFGKALKNSLVTASLTTLCSLLLAFLMAWLLCRTMVPGKQIWKLLFLLPMMIPSISEGTGLVLLLGTNGIITKGLHLPGSIYGPQGIILGQVLYTAPVAFLLLFNVLRCEDYTPHEAARVLGIPTGARFLSLTLPYLKREGIATAFLIFSMSVTDYGIPLSVGGKTKTLATIMYSKVAGQLQFGQGCVIGACLLVPAILSFAADTYGRRRKSTVSLKKPFPLTRRPGADRLALLLCLMASAVFLLPILAFCTIIFLEDYPLHMTFTWSHIAKAWEEQGRSGLLRSLAFAAGTAAGGTVIAVMAAYSAARQKGTLPRLIHLMSVLVLSIPGLVLGLSYILAFKGSVLYGTMAILILSGIVHFFTSPYLMLYQSFSKMYAELEAVGQTLGIPPFRLFLRVILPQCRETLVDMASYFFVNAMITISAVSFLATAGTRPLSLLVTQYSDQLNLEMAAVLSAMILLINILAKGAAAGLQKLSVRRSPWK